MLSYFSKMNNKKGFTIIEMIVVITIIGVLSAIAVPSFISSQRRSEGRKSGDYARSFYNGLQQTLASYLSKDNTNFEFSLAVPSSSLPFYRTVKRVTPDSLYGDSFSDRSGAFFLYAEVGTGSTVSYADLCFAAAGDYRSGGDAAIRGGTVGDMFAAYPKRAVATPDEGFNDGALEGIMNELSVYFKTADSDGYFYAMFDTDFRVSMVYYSRYADRSRVAAGSGLVITSGGWIFDRDNEIGGYVFGAYPREYGYIRSRLYDYPERQWFNTTNHYNAGGAELGL
jgi:prepilin-type N-terminal cleavage/methylation domain-containing protein